MITELDRRDVDVRYNYYRSVQGTRESALLCGKMFEAKVHKFSQSITESWSFTIHFINNPLTTFDIEFSSTKYSEVPVV